MKKMIKEPTGHANESWVFLTKTAKGKFWLFLPEKLWSGWLSHNLSQ